jgi:pyruvate/2-oxoglutarate/acetoin dehydrogenase E1 component/TPP-dependent pyruvate/acetoin dehydrogenase alpha subunit
MSGQKANGKPKAHRALEALGLSREEILEDYRCAVQSRQASYTGWREVMSGKAKFGIFGSGKELPQLAMARVFQPGDWRSGYYRDQTLMFATGMTTLEQFFAQLYAHTDVQADPASAGRQMNAHFATRSIDTDGNWIDLTAQKNSAADVSPTASQMPRAVGLAYASRLFRQLEELKPYSTLSRNGNEIAFVIIGNASAAEGLFWESVNAIGVLRSPALITVYDDGYGISVTNESQIAKEDISELLNGFHRPPDECCDGFDIYRVHGWDYPSLIETYRNAAQAARRDHLPSLIHVDELTQPQGHSTSGSHERYKSKERLEWEKEWDCIKKFREWILAKELASAETLDQIEKEDRELVEKARKRAWDDFQEPILADRTELAGILERLAAENLQIDRLGELRSRVSTFPSPLRRDLSAAARQALVLTRQSGQAAIPSQARGELVLWSERFEQAASRRYHSHIYLEGNGSALKVEEVKPLYAEGSPEVYGFELLNAAFDQMLKREPRLIAFGEDVGKLGDVNQGMRGMQEKYGLLRVSDTGIREATILGQAIGMAMRGLRPLCEIQYLDYVLYALQIMSDDLATLLWRTLGGQRAPVIIRTRGHRLEGIWHSGSPMAGIIHLVRGMHVLVPRNMTRAAGFYNTLLQAEEPALLVEVLNGYRLKERLPENLGEMRVPLGIPEILREGSDLTLVTYGACCRIALEAATQLSQVGIETEVIDVQTLLPFDVNGLIVESLQKTGRILFLDEDMPGGTCAYMMQQVIEQQGGYSWLDSAPRTLSASNHRPAYGSDGDYWSKPNVETVFETAYEILREVDPGKYARLD